MRQAQQKANATESFLQQQDARLPAIGQGYSGVSRHHTVRGCSLSQCQQLVVSSLGTLSLLSALACPGRRPYQHLDKSVTL